MNVTNGDRFEGWLESAKIQSKLDDVLRGADDGELYLEYSELESFEFADGTLKSADMTASRGFGLRTVCGDLVGFAHASQLSHDALSRATDAVRLAKMGASGQWDVSPDRTNARPYLEDNPVASSSVELKIATLKQIDDYARSADPRVQQVSVALSGAWSVIQILRAGGERYSDVRPQVQLNVNVTMAENGRTEMGGSSIGGRFDLTRLLAEDLWQEHVEEAIRIATVNLLSIPAPAGRQAVVLEAGWPGVMIHEAVGHGLEGDKVRKGQSVYVDKVGAQVAAKGVTVVDHGALDERRGSLSIDDEGTPARENVLIEDGVLKGYMHDRLSARLMGVRPTGNGRRQSYAHPILPRMTNTYMTSGQHTREDILSSVKEGVYAAKLGGGQVNTVNGDFVFQCTEAYLIRNGRIEEPIKGATLIGNGPEAMKNISMVGNNSALDQGGGTCGKEGQSVPVCVGQPTLRMEDMTVGGTSV